MRNYSRTDGVAQVLVYHTGASTIIRQFLGSGRRVSLGSFTREQSRALPYSRASDLPAASSYGFRCVTAFEYEAGLFPVAEDVDDVELIREEVEKKSVA